METQKLGTSDLRVSQLGLGCNNFGMTLDQQGTQAVVDAASDCGISFFDTADMYGGTKSESFLGVALRDRRHSVVLATKFGGIAYASGGSDWGRREAIVACVEASLRRLKTDRVDLYQLHYLDPATPIDETLAALEELIGAGKILAFGCSNVTAEFLAEASGFATVQNEWSLLNREVEDALVPACEAAGIGFLPYFPLASGVLTGKYKLGEEFQEGTRLGNLDYFKHFGSEENLKKAQQLEAFAKDCGHTLLDLALSWLASQSCVASVIAGATRAVQVRQNAKAIGWKLSEHELAEVDALTTKSDPDSER